MKTFQTVILCLISLLFVSCSGFQLRDDPSPSPVGADISQTRMEFSGCGKPSQIGTIACVPGDKISIVTEFKGDVIYFSSGSSCSVRVQTRATPPLTELKFEPVSSICAVSVYYLPEYTKDPSTNQVFGIFGEVSLQPDATYTPENSFFLSTAEILKLTYPGAVRGAYISRQFTGVQNFVGDTISIKPVRLGTDLVQIKLWMQDGSIQTKVVPGDFFSPSAMDLLVSDISKKKKYILVTYPDWVSAVTVNGAIYNNLEIKIPLNFSGYLRAYTVKGRTNVSYFEQGELKWSK